MEILFKDYIADTIWRCNKILEYQDQLTSDSKSTRESAEQDLYEKSGKEIKLNQAACAATGLYMLCSAHVTSYGYTRNRFPVSHWSDKNDLKTYLSVKYICKSRGIHTVEAWNQNCYPCSRSSPCVTYPIGGEDEWDLALETESFWQNEKRFEFVEFIRDELEYLLRNGKLRNDFPLIFGEV